MQVPAHLLLKLVYSHRLLCLFQLVLCPEHNLFTFEKNIGKPYFPHSCFPKIFGQQVLAIKKILWRKI
jgi:hypothetical protein